MIGTDFVLCFDHNLWEVRNFPSANFHCRLIECLQKDLILKDDAATMHSFVPKFLPRLFLLLCVGTEENNNSKISK